MQFVKKLVVLSIICLFAIAPVKAFAAWDIKKDIRDLKADIQIAKKEFRADVKENSTKPGILKSILFGRAAIGSGKISTINGSTLTVTKGDKTYTVLTGIFEACTTQFKRKFWGNSSVTEMRVGDAVNVMGKWQDDTKTIIQACLVRDTSIQKRNAVFVGHVLSISSTGWTMTAVNESRTNQTVIVSGSTKFVNRKETVIAQKDISVGHRVRVMGLWNRATNTVSEVTHVKDFSLPISTPTPTP